MPSTTITYPSHGEYTDPDQPDRSKESKAHHAHVLYLDTQHVFADYGTWTCHRCSFSDNLHPWHWCQQCRGSRTLDSLPTPGTRRKWGNTRTMFYNKEAEKLLRLTRVAKHRATYTELPSGGDTQAAASMTVPAPVQKVLGCRRRPGRAKQPKHTHRANPPRTIRQLLGATVTPWTPDGRALGRGGTPNSGHTTQSSRYATANQRGPKRRAAQTTQTCPYYYANFKGKRGSATGCTSC